MLHENLSQTGQEITRHTIEKASEAREIFSALAQFIREKSNAPDIKDFERPLWQKQSERIEELSDACFDLLETYRKIEELAEKMKAAEREAAGKIKAIKKQALLN